MKYYGVAEEVKEITGWCSEQEGKPTLGGMKKAAIRAGMKASLYVLDLKILQELKESLILFTTNFEEKPSYSVCYGLHEGRYIIYEPEGGPIQYEPEELGRRWIKGICMTLTVTMEFLTKAPFELRWWWPPNRSPSRGRNGSKRTSTGCGSTSCRCSGGGGSNHRFSPPTPVAGAGHPSYFFDVRSIRCSQPHKPSRMTSNVCMPWTIRAKMAASVASTP